MSNQRRKLNQLVMERLVVSKTYPVTNSSTRMNGINPIPLASLLATSPTTAKIYPSQWSDFPLIHSRHFAYIRMTHYLSRLTMLLSQRSPEQVSRICINPVDYFLQVTPTKLATSSNQVASRQLVMPTSSCSPRPMISCRSPSRQTSAAISLTLLSMMRMTGYSPN